MAAARGQKYAAFGGMSTYGYLIAYDVEAFRGHVAPLAGKPVEAVVAALEAHPDALLWDDETREVLAAQDHADLLRLAFSAWCVSPDAQAVPLGRHTTLGMFGQELDLLDETAGLRGPMTAWARPAAGAWHVDGAFELIPSERSVAEALWTRAQALGLTPLDDREAEALTQSAGGDPRLTLSWLGRVLQTPGLSVAYFYESLRMPSKRAPVPDALRVLQDALAQDGLPPWDAVHEHTGTPQLVWVRSYGLQRRVHAAVDLEGSQRFVNWEAPPFWRRLFGTSTDPVPQGAGDGACAVQDCRLCAAASRAAGFSRASRRRSAARTLHCYAEPPNFRRFSASAEGTLQKRTRTEAWSRESPSAVKEASA